MDNELEFVHLEIDGLHLESIRFFGNKNLGELVEVYKKIHSLSEGDDFIFYLVRPSKMNEIDFENY